MSVIKRLKLQIFCAVIAFVMSVAALSGLSAFAGVFAADNSDDGVNMYYYTPTNAGLDNGSFASYSSGSAAHSPSSWSGAAMGDSNSGNVVSGVVLLDGADFTGKYKDELKLDATGIKPELLIPNPENVQPNQVKNKAALMINNPAETAFAYTSNSFTLAANSHYEISAYILTSNFAAEMGAYFRLNFGSGAEKNLSFDKINTNNEWVEYKFYVESSSYKSESVTITLQNGDYLYNETTGRYTKAPSKGVCFFYEVSALTITAETYNKYINSDTSTVKIKSYINKSPLQFENSDFENPALDGSTWKPVENNNSGKATLGIYGMKDFQTYKDRLDIANIPMTADGSDRIFIFRGNEAFNHAIKSSKITLEIAKFYSIRVMVKTENVSGSGITVKLKGDDTRTDGEFTQTVNKATSSSVTDNSLFGWEALNIFVSASTLKPCDVYLEIHFGDIDNPQTGTAYIDAFLIEEISQREYNEGGAALSYALDNSGEDTSGISNGFFNIIGETKTFEYPLPASGWTTQTASDVENPGQSVKTTSVKSGIVNITSAHYNQNKHNYGNVPAPSPGTDYGPNNLMIYSPEMTVFGYSSEAVTLNANGTGHFKVTLNTVNLTGNKATLIVKRSGQVISTIRNVASEQYYTDFDFYIESNGISHSLTIEIWMGNPYGNKSVNDTASGHIFVDSVTYSEISGTKTYADYEDSYNRLRVAGGVPQDLSFAAFSFKNQAFAGYDYLDTNPIKTPYFWTLSGNTSFIASGAISGGIIDFTNNESKAQAANMGFDNSGAKAGSTSAIVLSNNENSFSTFTAGMSHTLSATPTPYYKVTFKVKTVGIDPNQYGAYIKLSGANDVIIEGINTTGNDYQDYVFYIRVGDQPIDINIVIGIGKNDKTKNYSRGTIVVGSVDFAEITEPIYTADIADLVSDDEDVVKPKNIQYVDLATPVDATEEPVDDNKNDATPWWLLPSILFGVAIIIALIGVPLKTLIKKKKFIFKKKGNATYDRKATMERVKQENLAKLNARIKENEEKLGEEDAEYEQEAEVTETADAQQDEAAESKVADEEAPAADELENDSDKYNE